jgi:predicted phage terminase large subunit-like protein
MVDQSPGGGHVVRGWDLAASTERDSANTAGVKIRAVGGTFYVEDVVCIKGTPHEVEQLIVRTAEQDGRDCIQDLPQDPGQAGKSQKSYLASKLAGFVAHFSPETGSKELRAEPFASQAQNLNVMIVRGNWNDAYLGELESFPAGRLRDRVDASSRAFARINAKRPSGVVHGGLRSA